MSRRDKDGCLSIISIIVFVVFSIVLAFKGNYLPLLVIMGVILVIYVFSLINEKPVSLNNRNDKISSKPPILNIKSYNISLGCLRGTISDSLLPKELLDLVDIESVDLRCENPLDISEFINSNKKLNRLKLVGPFYLKNQINEESKIIDIKLIGNSGIYEFLSKSNEFLNLTHLSIQSHVELNLVDKLNNLTSLKNIHIVAKIKHCPTFYNCPNLQSIQLAVNNIKIFPYEYFYLDKLRSLTLSNNEISFISKSTLSRMSNTNLEFLYLDSNLLNNIPIEIFKFKSLKKISVSFNPISVSNLKKISRLYSHIINIDLEQKAKMEKTYIPELKRLAMFFLYLIIVFIPYVYFNHGGISFLFFLIIIYGLSQGVLRI